LLVKDTFRPSFIRKQLSPKLVKQKRIERFIVMEAPSQISVTDRDVDVQADSIGLALKVEEEA